MLALGSFENRRWGLAAALLLVCGCPTLDGYTSHPADAAACDLSKVANDPRNCGRCGHDCLGGDCRAGACQPFVMSGLSGAYLSVDDVAVFWAPSAEKITRCDKAGCGAGASELWANPSTLEGVLVTVTPWDTKLLFAVGHPTTNGFYNDVWSVGKDGSGLAKLFVGEFLPEAVGNNGPRYAATGSTVLWLGSDATHDAAVLWRCTLPGCNDRTKIVEGLSGADFLSADASSVIFIDGPPAQRIVTCPVAGCPTPTTLYTPTNQFSLVSATPVGPWVYFTEINLTTTPNTNGAVKRVARSGGAPVDLVALQPAPDAVTADETHVYWSNTGDATIMMQSLDGGDPVTLAGGQLDAREMAVDRTALYWLSTAGIVRLAL